MSVLREGNSIGNAEGRDEASSRYSQFCDLAWKCRKFVQCVLEHSFQFCNFTRWEYVDISKCCKITVFFFLHALRTSVFVLVELLVHKSSWHNLYLPITVFILLISEDGIALRCSFYRDVYLVIVSY